MNKTRVDSFFVFAGQLVYSGTSFISSLVLARLLSLEDFGVFSGTLLITYLFVAMSNAVVVQPCQLSIAMEKQPRRYITFILILQVCFLIPVYFVVTLLPGIIGLKVAASSLTFYVMSFVFNDVVRKVHLAMNMITSALIMDFVGGAIQIAFLCYALFGGVDLELRQVWKFGGVAFLAATTCGIIMLRPQSITPGLPGEWWRLHMHHGKWLLLAAIVQWWSNNLFVTASGIFIGPIALGAFRLVQSLFGVLNVFLQAYENYALPKATGIFQSSVKDAREYLRGFMARGGITSVGIVLFAFFFSEQVIRVAGGTKYIPYAYVVPGVSLLYMIILVGYPIRIAIRMMGLSRSFFLGYVFSLVFSLITFSVLLREWQLWGVIIGLVANQVILLGFWQYVLATKKFVIWR